MVSEHTGHVPEMRRKGCTLIALNVQHIAICIEAIRMVFAHDSICVEKIEMAAGDIAIPDFTWAMTMETIALVAKDIALKGTIHALRLRGISLPRAGIRGIGVWVPSAEHAMLRRHRYLGRVAWRHVHKAYKSGFCVRTNEHRHDVVSVAAPQLRMVADERWNAMHALLRTRDA